VKKKFSILLLISLSALNIHAATRSFDFRDAGEVYFSDLEREISPGLDYEDVVIQSIRNSYNPIAYLASLASDYNAYVIDMTINHSKNVRCELVEIKDDKKIMIKRCQGSRPDVVHRGFIFYKDIQN
jgi:hypothetical protein